MDQTTHALTRIAQRHHGLFRLEDARHAGVGRRVVDGLVRIGWCERPRHGVYRIAGAPSTFDQSLLAAAWFCGADAVASHRSAARMWATPGFVGGRPEVTKPRGQSQRKPYGLVHGSLVLPVSHVTERRSIPVTTPARTVFDLAGVVPAGRTERALEHMVKEGLCSIADLHQVFFALARRGRRGTVVMRRLLDARGPGYVATASDLERLGRTVFREGGLRAPAFEVDLGAVEWIGRVDAVWKAERVIVELDSRKHHTSLLARDADRRRDNELMAAGWRLIRVTWEDLRERPDEVVRWIRTALAASARLQA